MFHFKPLVIGITGLTVTLLTLLPFNKKEDKPICYDCSIDLIKKHNDSLKEINKVLYTKVKDTLQVGKKAILEVQELKKEVKELKINLAEKPIIIHDTVKIHDTIYYAKGFLGKYKAIERTKLFKIIENNIDTLN